MITDFQCNTVYFSALLQGRAPVTYANLISALDKHGVEHRLISVGLLMILIICMRLQNTWLRVLTAMRCVGRWGLR